MKNTKRLFIGLKCPISEESFYKDMLRKLKITADKKELDVKWTHEENLHLTLKFLDAVDYDKIESIKKSLGKIAKNISPFQLNLKGLDGFPDIFKCRALWIGSNKCSELAKLHEEINEALVRMGFDGEKHKDFIPHITIGRTRSHFNAKDMASPFTRKAFMKIDVDKVVLFESHLQHYIPTYSILEEWDFKK